MTRVSDLVELLGKGSTLLILCHDDPDPDCLASALALREIAVVADLKDVQITHGGNISHQQNRTFVNLFDIEITPISDVSISEGQLVALVDHSQPSSQGDIPTDLTADIVIDHHPQSEPIPADFVDIRDDYGATTSILIEYLRELEIELGAHLASALIFALHRERLDYMRNPTEHEYEAALHVYPHIDQGLLEQLYGSAFSPATLDAIGEAIQRRNIRGSSLVSAIGRTTERDALPQAADYLLNLEGIDTTLVFGIVGDTIHLSARSVDPRINIGETLQEGFSDVGTAGGHQDMAGGQIPLGIFADEADDDEELIRFVSKRVTNRFFGTLRLDEKADETDEPVDSEM